jgi:serine/threonine protein kinase
LQAQNIKVVFKDIAGNSHSLQCKQTLGEGLSGLICTASYKEEFIVIKFFGLTADSDGIHVKTNLIPADIHCESKDYYILEPYNNMSDFILENAVLEHASKCKIVPEKKFSGVTIIRDRAIPFIGCEFVKGKSVKQMVAHSQNGNISLKEKLLIAGRLLEGLGELHDLGIVNRDIKSAHVIVDDNFGIKLLDYGASSLKGKTSKNKIDYKIISHEYNRSAWQIFTPWFLDPYRGKKPKPSDDIYSVGIVIGELITNILLSSEISMDNVMTVARGNTLHYLSKYVRQPLYEELKQFAKKGKIEKQVVGLLKSHFRPPMFRPNAFKLSRKYFELMKMI